MRKNTHLHPDSYFDETELGEMLSEEMNELASEALDKEAIVVVFCDDTGSADKYGYEVRVGDKHVQIDSGHESALDSVVAFQDWADRMLGEDEDDDEAHVEGAEV